VRTGTGTARPHRLTRVGVVAVLAWVLAVVVGSAIAWRALAVVDSGERTGVLSQTEVAAALAQAQGPVTPAPTPTPSVTPTPAATPTSTPVSPPPSTPVSPPIATPTATSTPPPAPLPTTAPPPPPTTAEVARTWTVPGGVVAVSCRGAAITLLYATPSDGWTVEVGSAGPERVEVELHRDHAETHLTGTCVGGTPQSHLDAQDAGSGTSDPADD